MSEWPWIALAAITALGLPGIAWIYRRYSIARSADPEQRSLEQRLWNRAVGIAMLISVTTMAVVLGALVHLYNVAFEETRRNLLNWVLTETHLIESVARHDQAGAADPAVARAATLRQIHEGFQRVEGSVEILLAEPAGDHVAYVFRQRAPNQQRPLRIPAGDESGQPMQRALAGESGAGVALDYRGRRVLAAYHYIEPLNLGLVIKRDVADIRAPYVQAALWIIVGTLLLMGLGILVYFRLMSPVVRLVLSSEGRFKFLYSTISSAFVAYRVTHDGADFAVSEVNRAAEEFEARPREQLVGERLSEQLTSGTDEDLRAAMFRVLRSGKGEYLPPLPYEVERSGRRWRSYHLYRLSGTEVAAIYDDVTDREQALVALRESEEKFRQITETIREVFWMSDPHSGQLLYVSPAYESIWGRPVARVVADPGSYVETIHPDDRERVIRGVEQRAQGPRDLEYRILRPDGTVRWIHDKSRPVTDEHGRVYRLAGVAEDVTEEKEREARLRQAQKLDSLGQIVGGVAHDFNNLLLVILGNVELLKDRLTHDPEVVRLVQNIGQAAERAAALTARLLTFARQKPLSRSLFDVNQRLREMAPLLRTSLGEDVVLELRLCPEPATVETDPDAFDTSILNLAVNARDAMPGGGRLIIGSSVREEAPLLTGGPDAVPASGDWVVVTVSDTGSGIPAELLDRVFDPFFTTKEPGKGTGLGLALVYAFARSFGGEAVIETGPGGTSVRLLLPSAAERLLPESADSDRRALRDGAPTP